MKLTANPPLGLLVSLAQKRIQQLTLLELEPFDVTPQQFWVLLLLDERALDSVQSVGERIGIDKPAASRLVEQLVDRGWVRLGAADSKRRRAVELTPPGRRQAERFRALALRLADGMEHGLNPVEEAAMAKGLGRMMANLDTAIAELTDKRRKNRSSKKGSHPAR